MGRSGFCVFVYPPLAVAVFVQLHKHKFFNFVQLTFSALVSVSINCSIFPQTLFVLVFCPIFLCLFHEIHRTRCGLHSRAAEAQIFISLSCESAFALPASGADLIDTEQLLASCNAFRFLQLEKCAANERVSVRLCFCFDSASATFRDSSVSGWETSR